MIVSQRMIEDVTKFTPRIKTHIRISALCKITFCPYKLYTPLGVANKRRLTYQTLLSRTVHSFTIESLVNNIKQIECDYCSPTSLSIDHISGFVWWNRISFYICFTSCSDHYKSCIVRSCCALLLLNSKVFAIYYTLTNHSFFKWWCWSTSEFPWFQWCLRTTEIYSNRSEKAEWSTADTKAST